MKIITAKVFQLKVPMKQKKFLREFLPYSALIPKRQKKFAGKKFKNLFLAPKVIRNGQNCVARDW